MTLTIAYFTNRRDCRIEWFFDSLDKQIRTLKPALKFQIVVVDFFQHERTPVWMGTRVDGVNVGSVVWVSPKSSVWQGPNRLTSEDWFAASNARNTAICLARGEWIAFVDDLSVLGEKWLERVIASVGQPSDTITLGTYQKVTEMIVEDGVMLSYGKVSGSDNRSAHVNGVGPHKASGQWLYGCSLVAPIKAFLKINGFDEDCDGMGFEDCIAGLMLERNGYKFLFDPQMMTTESEELHSQGPVFVRKSKRSKHDPLSDKAAQDWTMLNMVTRGQRNYAPNYFGEGGIRALRESVLAGAPFPSNQIPEHHWFDGQPLREMKSND
jgi:glycosyltransferase involved in cell wall biosynthesis